MHNFNGVTNFRHRRSPSSDRFLDLFSSTPPSSVSNNTSDELTESDILWTISDPARDSPSRQAPRKLGFRIPEKSGILAALPEEGSRPRAIPRPQHAGAERRFQNSAPVNVPAAMRNARRFSELDEEYDDEKEEAMLPPHEIVAMKVKKTSSVLEGVGRTLKGRDLRQVRDAVWRQSGFTD